MKITATLALLVGLSGAGAPAAPATPSADEILERNFAALGAHEVQDDGTPIELHAADLFDHVVRAAQSQGSITLRAVFEGRTRSEMLGLFLAMLELVRQRKVTVQQEGDSISLTPAPVEEPSSPLQSSPA